MGRRGVLVAVLVWLSLAVIGWSGVRGGLVVAALGGLTSVITRKGIIALATGAGVLAGVFGLQGERMLADTRLPTGDTRIAAAVATDPIGTRYLVTPQALWIQDRWVSWRGPPLLAISYRLGDLNLGDNIELVGPIEPISGSLRGRPYAGKIEASPRRVTASQAPWMRLGNGIRRAVGQRLDRWEDDPAAGLLRGFLMGDVSRVPESDVEALRRTGLSHFVAVSGSNVALFLALWWAALAPVAVRPRLRALVGLLGLGAFVVATRAEPSVVRAGVMAGLVLAARLAGYSLDAWTAFGTGITGVLLLSPELAGSTGFQLSAAATAGVMLGAKAGVGWRSQIGAALGAQGAVLPLLLWKFGSVPLFGPILNLAVAPMVAAASLLGGAGVGLRLDPLTTVAVALARSVLVVARAAQSFPQAGGWVLILALAGGGAALRKRWRPVAVLVGCTCVLAFVVRPPAALPQPSVVFLSIGQGDATLLKGQQVTVLIDGGPDPELLTDRLDRYGIRRIDLMILTHPHEDHLAGLVPAMERLAVGALWEASSPHQSKSLEALLEVARRRGVTVTTPRLGSRIVLGEFTIEVLGPQRRYAGPNDQSIVLAVSAGGHTLLLAGDVETIAQSELPHRAYEIVKVPHHGGGTSDASWLMSVVEDIAVVSVGDNTYGHPEQWVMDLLAVEAEVVHRTDRDGDIVIPLS